MFLFIAHIDVFFIPKEDSINLIFAYSVSSDRLLFKRKADEYISKYAFESEIVKDGELFSSFIREHEIKLKSPSTEKVIKNHYIVKPVPYGNYRVISHIRDMNTKETMESETTYIDVSKGDIIVGSILNVISLDTLQFSYKEEYSDEDELHLVLPIYSRVEDTVEIVMDVLGRRNEGDRLNIDYSLKKGMNEVNIDYDIAKLKFDDYTITLNVYYRGKLLAKRQMNFRKVGFMSLSEREMKALIGALEFVYPGEFNRYYREANGNFEKAWKKFWKDKDPTPNTPENEYEETFMQRFKYALYNFYRLGRITDMGLIYIKYGPPDYIEKGEMLLEGKSYQIWYYNSINRRFIFVDKYGIGEYDLVPSNIYNDF